jgi:GNAT superfamily N-acetyltransferase
MHKTEALDPRHEHAAAPAVPRSQPPSDPHGESPCVTLIAQLGPGHRKHIESHLRSLPMEDRRLRFGHAISDASLAAYVRRIKYHRDAAFGAFDDSGSIRAFGHLAFEAGGEAAELGISVDPAVRKQGVGLALLERAAAHARNRGHTRLVMAYLPENAALASLARRAGMQIVFDPVEPRAYLSLEPASPASMLQEAFGEAIAALDLGFRLNTDPARTTSA